MKHLLTLLILCSTISAFGQAASVTMLRATNAALRAEIAQKAGELTNLVTLQTVMDVPTAITGLGLAPDDLGGGTYNGVTVATGDRILLYGTGSGEDGVYIVASSGTRAPEFDGIKHVRVQLGTLAGAVFEGFEEDPGDLTFLPPPNLGGYASTNAPRFFNATNIGTWHLGTNGSGNVVGARYLPGGILQWTNVGQGTLPTIVAATFIPKSLASNSIVVIDAAGKLATGIIGAGLSYDPATGTLTATGSGTGDVVGPSSATDTAIVVYDGTTGKLVKDSLATVDGSGNISTPGDLHVGGTFGATAMTVDSLSVSNAKYAGTNLAIFVEPLSKVRTTITNALATNIVFTISNAADSILLFTVPGALAGGPNYTVTFTNMASASVFNVDGTNLIGPSLTFTVTNGTRLVASHTWNEFRSTNVCDVRYEWRTL